MLWKFTVSTNISLVELTGEVNIIQKSAVAEQLTARGSERSAYIEIIDEYSVCL